MCGMAEDEGAVDAYSPASLLPGLELFIQSMLLCHDFCQEPDHSLESLLIGVE